MADTEKKAHKRATYLKIENLSVPAGIDQPTSMLCICRILLCSVCMRVSECFCLFVCIILI